MLAFAARSSTSASPRIRSSRANLTENRREIDRLTGLRMGHDRELRQQFRTGSVEQLSHDDRRIVTGFDVNLGGHDLAEPPLELVRIEMSLRTAEQLHAVLANICIADRCFGLTLVDRVRQACELAARIARLLERVSVDEPFRCESFERGTIHFTSTSQMLSPARPRRQSNGTPIDRRPKCGGSTPDPRTSDHQRDTT